MRVMIACLVLAVALPIGGSATAGGVGKFLAALLARGVLSTAVYEARTHKNYSPDVLTVGQLAQCLKRASALDQQQTELEKLNDEVGGFASNIRMIEAALNQHDKAAVDRFNVDVDNYNSIVGGAKSQQDEFNASVDGYNAACAKKYFADDMEAAKN